MYKCVLIADIIPDVSRAISLGPFGSNLNTQHYTDDGLPVIRGVNLAGDHFSEESFAFTSPSLADKFPRSIVYPGDIVFSYKGTIGQVGIIPKNGHFDRYIISPSHLKLTVDRTKVDPEFVFYFFKSPLGQQALLANVSSTGTPGIIQPTKTLARIELPLPELSEQRAIAHILGTLDDKIELNRRMNETLEGIARALFRSWFIDFDPVRAKVEGQQPFGMDEETAALFPDQFEDSELGEIPKGWAVGKLSDICTTQYGYTASAEESAVGPKLLRVTDINKRDYIIWDDVPHCAIPDDLLEKYKLAKGDLVVARMADPGKAAIIDDDTNAIFASYLVRLRTHTLADNYYVHGFLKSSVYQQYAEDVKGGSVQANMNAKVIVGCPIVIPTSAIIDAYYKKVIQIREKITSNLAINSALYRLRDSLLPKLISGEIRINPCNFGFVPENEQVGEV